MLFNSLTFAVFLPLVFMLYWFVFQKSLVWQNMLIVVASYLFYGWWDWRFLSLIALSTLVDFVIGNRLQRCRIKQVRRLLLFTSLAVNLGLLGFFKYYNFFVDSWLDVWSALGVHFEPSTLQVILPVGISFYTFQTLSYTIDVYKGRTKSSRNLIEFAAYVAFFPQLVAGPIERAKHLLPQFETKRIFQADFAIRGFNLIIWGLFKKMVVADNCAFFVNRIFDNPEGHNSMTLFVGAVLFSLQIYGDFSGYTDIAIGTARLFGFDLKANFKFPYFSRNVAEFWRRWHISLSSWFKDYLYIPMGGSQVSTMKTIRNVFVVFLVSGLWHGANWTFVVWGAIHAVLFLPLLLVKRNRLFLLETRFSLNQVVQVLFTFCLVSLTWVVFRASSIGVAWDYWKRIFEFTGSSLSFFMGNSKMILFSVIIVVSAFVLFLFEILAVRKRHSEVILTPIKSVLIGLMIVFMGVFKNPETFIYFQF